MYEKSTIFSLLPSQNHYFKSYICGSLFFQMAATQPNKHKDRRNGQANTDNLGNRKNLEIRVSAKIAPENLDVDFRFEFSFIVLLTISTSIGQF